MRALLCIKFRAKLELFENYAVSIRFFVKKGI